MSGTYPKQDDQFTAEQTAEILELCGRIKDMGKDPAAVLKFYIQAGETIDKFIELGKETGTFLKQQWDQFEDKMKK